MNNASIIII